MQPLVRAVDFWIGMQGTPLAQRHEQLREPLYRELLQRMLAKCTLPASFTSWDDEDELDEDEWERFREQSAQEVLAVCMQLLHVDFVNAVLQVLASPGWQPFELAFFAT